MFYQTAPGAIRAALAAQYLSVTGEKIGYAVLNKLITQFGVEAISDALKNFPKRKIEKPLLYLAAMCKNMESAKTGKVEVRNDAKLEASTRNFMNETNRQDRPKFERPEL